MAAAAILEKFRMAISPQRLTIYLYSAHRAVIFAIAQLSCFLAFSILAHDSMCLACYMPVCSSVRLSHEWISQKRLNVGLCNFQHRLRLLHPSSFCGVSLFQKVLTGSPEPGRQTTEGGENKPFSVFKRQYLENGRRDVQS